MQCGLLGADGSAGVHHEVSAWRLEMSPTHSEPSDIRRINSDQISIDTTHNDMTRGVCIVTEPAENVSEPSRKLRKRH